MEGKMKVAVMEGIGKMGFTERPIPTPKDDEVLVKLEYVGICGSDLHYYEHGRIGDYIVEPPFVLGHEPGGTVVEVGKDVKHLKVGDRVALEPGKTCGHCELNDEGYQFVKKAFKNQDFQEIPQTELVKLAQNAKFIVRSGELRCYSNILLEAASGVDTFKKNFIIDPEQI